MKKTKKNKKLVNGSKIVNHQPKTIEILNITDTKSVTVEHVKNSCKLSKTIRQAKNVFQVGNASKNSNSPFYSEATKTEIFLMKKRL